MTDIINKCRPKDMREFICVGGVKEQVSDIDFNKQQIILICGNGVNGKTTLARIIANMFKGKRGKNAKVVELDCVAHGDIAGDIFSAEDDIIIVDEYQLMSKRVQESLVSTFNCYDGNKVIIITCDNLDKVSSSTVSLCSTLIKLDSLKTGDIASILDTGCRALNKEITEIEKYRILAECDKNPREALYLLQEL